jgi:Abnormal spindle-like microcephaly-assoc'd, ASPM-SPD-2-Hydin
MKVSFLAGLLILVVGSSLAANAQTIDYDWAARSLGQFPTNISQTRSATVHVHHVNDILYSYTVKVECTQTQSDPFGSIVGLFPGQAKPSGAPPASPCDQAISDAQAAIAAAQSKINEMLNLPTSGAGCSATSPCDIDLITTQSFWDNNIDTLVTNAHLAVQAAQKVCSSNAVNALVAADQALLSYRNRVKSGMHDYSVPVVLIPDSSCQLTITQRFKGTQTQNGSVVATFSPGQPRLTLSAGPLFSQVQDRSYSVVAIPSGSSTQNVLQFNGVSTFTTYLTALANFHIPSSNEWINGERFGVAVSTGPVLRVGGQSSASAFGWFGGVSYYINHLIFVTGGFHVGQFAGPPPGFSAPNQVVPPNFPTPTPQNRTTVRFALAVTLKAKDFSSLSSGKAAAGAGSPATPATPQTPATPATPQTPAPGSVSLSVPTLDFGTQALNTSSAAKPVTFKNGGSTALNITSITITGTNLGEFTQTNTCGQTLAAGGSCTLNVTFSPTAAGAKTATVKIVDSAAGSPRSVALTGTGQ